jgi:hypothetical protein
MYLKELPRGITHFLKKFRKVQSKAQHEYFQTLAVGLIVNDNKTVQAICDALSKKDQSCMNKSITNNSWDAVNNVRLKLVKKYRRASSDGLIIIDDELAHKTGRRMEKAGYHRSGVTKRKEWGHCIVDSYYVDNSDDFGFPVNADIYVNKKSCSVKEYKPKIELALKQAEYGMRMTGAETVIMDSVYYADYVVNWFKSKNKRYVLGIHSNLKISMKRCKRFSVDNYASGLCCDDFTPVEKNGEFYLIHSVIASVRNAGVQRLLISYKQDDWQLKFYVTDLMNKSDEELMLILLQRWNVESFHRDMKQHLGLEDYQLRKYRGIRNVVLAVLVAYTVLILCQNLRTMKRVGEVIGRRLRTIGELCRFMRLAAQKGWRWITRLLKKSEVFIAIMNREVLVKNAKV